jgi:hypothetical protein
LEERLALRRVLFEDIHGVRVAKTRPGRADLPGFVVAGDALEHDVGVVEARVAMLVDEERGAGHAEGHRDVEGDLGVTYRGDRARHLDLLVLVGVGSPERG